MTRKFLLGEPVYHPLFGEGRVLEHPDVMVSVDFPKLADSQGGRQAWVRQEQLRSKHDQKSPPRRASR